MEHVYFESADIFFFKLYFNNVNMIFILEMAEICSVYYKKNDADS